ncbi:DnaJ domain-containing protein [Roseomonas terrae]|jgi:hypothetical protein|uniref:DnaJ domain-containing protein n=1 Tax=Neoroseomonas terrae TaxID=424799 RepID=A0ABS5EJA9_9PROT|nr:DnaJ domain-containing protein [Neoroseomonas terrae]MBR0651114.1 DnaJ domain-containing protein [Neoroseomonas terrae]
MTWVALGGIVLVAVMLGLRAFANARVGTVKAALAWIAGGLGVVLFAALLFSGRGLQAIWAIALLAPLLMRSWHAWRSARTFSRGGQASPGQETRVETATLAMVLHHDSGRMTGTVTAGVFAGADLAALALADLRALLADCERQDPESVPLLEAWLDRAHPEWRDAAQPSEGAMDRAEALAVLGLAEGATEAEIRAAYRRLMRAAHPDQGGSAWLAARLNAARDLLLGD